MRIASCIAMLGLTSAAAIADTVDVRFLNVGPSRIVSVTGAHYNGAVYAGALNHQFANGTGAALGLNGVSATFCTELTQVVSNSYHSFSLVTLANAPTPGSGMGADKARAIQEIYYRAGSAWGSQQYTDADLAAGFQALIWKIVYDYNPLDKANSLAFNNGLGDVHVTGLSAAAIAFANDLISAGIDSGNLDLRVAAVVSPEYQDQLVLVPIPAAPFLVATVAPLFLLAFRRRGR